MPIVRFIARLRVSVFIFIYLLLNSDRCVGALCWQKQLKSRDYADSDSSWLDTSWDSGPGWPLLQA